MEANHNPSGTNDGGERGTKPPYLSHVTFTNFLKQMKAGVIPNLIDKTMMNGHSGSVQSHLITSLRFFGLTDESDTPTLLLAQLVKADEANAKAVWKNIFDASYKRVIGDLNLEKATEGQLHDRFAKFGLKGDTLRKCQSFFVAVAKDAGVTLSPLLDKPGKKSTGPRKSKPRKKVSTQEAPVQVVNSTGDVAILRLDAAGVRFIKLEAPPSITSAELGRIQKWLSFQLIVDDELHEEDDEDESSDSSTN